MIDVISDTEVSGDWLDRIASCAARAGWHHWLAARIRRRLRSAAPGRPG